MKPLLLLAMLALSGCEPVNAAPVVHHPGDACTHYGLCCTCGMKALTMKLTCGCGLFYNCPGRLDDNLVCK